MNLFCDIPDELLLGLREKQRVPMVDQKRQRAETEEILARLAHQPGVVLADEVGMGKTFVALAVSYSVGSQSRKGPVVVMVPPNLIDKWVQDLDTFCSLYLDGVTPVRHTGGRLRRPLPNNAFPYGMARHSVEFLKLLDDPPSCRCQIVFLASGAMSRSQTDIWVRLAMIRETLRRYGRRERLRKVKSQVHRFLAELLHAKKWEQQSKLGDEIWAKLLAEDTRWWKEIFNENIREGRSELSDDPVPAAVIKALRRVELRDLADKLAQMPVRARGGNDRVSERIAQARQKIREVEDGLWEEILAEVRWRSPLLVLDEAHHLKNPKTALARQLQSPESEATLAVGDGAMAESFDRMLFLTATPFQLGHHELVRVLERFGDVRWDKEAFGDKEDFENSIAKLSEALTASQRSAVRIQKRWAGLSTGDLGQVTSVNQWWDTLLRTPAEELTHHQKSLIEAYQEARRRREPAEKCLRPWIIRHNKGEQWPSGILRRKRLDGARIRESGVRGGIEIPSNQLLPFFLAARSAADPGKDLLGEALCSSYEAFRRTRRDSTAVKDDSEVIDAPINADELGWYLEEFDRMIGRFSGAVHPKIQSTVQRVVDLWEEGEKVIVFAFYRHTCRALREHISRELEKRLMTHARRRLAGAGVERDDETIANIIGDIQKRYFDNVTAPGRQALDRALRNLLEGYRKELDEAAVDAEGLLEIMRRFLRVRTTLVRAFPIHQLGHLEPHLAVRSLLDSQDASGVSWREKFHGFLKFLVNECSPQERQNYVEAVEPIRTGRIRVHAGDRGEGGEEAVLTLASVRVATGETKRDTRAQLMRTFNTPFLPDILVCSHVMGEGVDLHRYCRYVIHHDLDWNPSAIEQRTGRVDRLGCKAENRHPIEVCLPYLSGAADERQYLVMTDRESWFRIVMGQDDVARVITADSENHGPKPPNVFQQELVFHLGIW